jgi:DNA replication protein DnaC
MVNFARRRNEQIGDPTFADGILDRLVHNAHRIEMRGESMRNPCAKTKSARGREEGMNRSQFRRMS